MGCSPHARAAYESIANAPTAPRNISSPWAGARAEMSPLSPSGALPSLKIAQDLAKAHGWGDYDAEIMDTQALQVSSSTSPEPMAATILQSSILRSFRMPAINWSCSPVCFRARRRSARRTSDSASSNCSLRWRRRSSEPRHDGRVVPMHTSSKRKSHACPQPERPWR